MEAKELAKITAESFKGYLSKLFESRITKLEHLVESLEHFEINPVDLDEFRSYARGTYAFNKGGILYAFRKTDMLDEYKGTLEQHGWTVAMNGLAEVKEDYLDERTTKFTVTQTDGSTQEHIRKIDSQIYRGVWQDGQHYEKGDTVTRQGSQWHCNRPTDEMPIGGCKDWTLCVKQGRQGKPA